MAGRFGALTVAAIVVTLAGLSSAAAQSRASAPAALPVATEVRIAGDDKETRLIVDVTRTLGIRAFTLADPYRVVIDIPQTVFQLPPASGETGRGLVKAYRFGLVMAGGSRIVIDVTKPVRIEKAAMLEAKDGQPARLILDLSATDREAFMRHLALDRAAMRESEASKVPLPQAKPSGDSRPLVVIDPGHGGPDTGTKAGGGEIMEKNVVLDFSVALRDQLEKSGRYRVVMTRTDDTFIPLAERVKFARSRQAQLFISIHADALPKSEGDVQGATVYTLSETASDAEAAKLAEAENRSDVIAGIDLAKEPDDVADILFDLAHRETKTFSHAFARVLVGEMKSAMRLHKKPLKAAGFVVLKAPDVPSVLVELGYMTNRSDLKLLTSESWRAKAAANMALAVEQFFRTRLAGTEAGAGRR